MSTSTKTKKTKKTTRKTASNFARLLDHISHTESQARSERAKAAWARRKAAKATTPRKFKKPKMILWAGGPSYQFNIWQDGPGLFRWHVQVSCDDFAGDGPGPDDLDDQDTVPTLQRAFDEGASRLMDWYTVSPPW